MSKHGKVIIEGDALKRLQQERMQHIDAHLEQHGHRTSIINAAMDLVLKADLSRGGIPDTEVERQVCMENATAMAKLIADERLKRFNEGVKDICTMLNVRDLPEHIVWAGRMAGVELLEVPVETPEAH
jgi:hypothetical protein